MKLRIIAEIEGIAGPDAIGAFLAEGASEFYERGRDSGVNAALVVSIAVSVAALEERTRDRVPLDWAMTQNNLGIALWTLAERESGTARLQEAAEAWSNCLLVTENVWPSELLQSIRDVRDEAWAEIARRSA